jgi:hypothetical protein
MKPAVGFSARFVVCVCLEFVDAGFAIWGRLRTLLNSIRILKFALSPMRKIPFFCSRIVSECQSLTRFNLCFKTMGVKQIEAAMEENLSNPMQNLHIYHIPFSPGIGFWF